MFIELRDVYEDSLFLVFSSLKKTRRRHQPRWDEIAERRLLDLVAAPLSLHVEKEENSKLIES